MPDTKPHTQALAPVFSCLYRAPEALTKQEIAAQAGISMPTVYTALAELDGLRLLEQGPERESTGGRRATTYGITRTQVAALGISVTGHSLRAIACNLFGEQLDGCFSQRTLDGIGGTEELADAIACTATEMAGPLEKHGIRIVGVGVAVPSAIDPASGRLLNTRVLHLQDEAVFAHNLVEAIPYPARVQNDANCGALAQRFPAADGESFTYLSLERGVGGAIIIDGKPFEGPAGTAAEFGHICIEPGGKQCACGKNGCLEAYCSSNVLSKERGCSLEEFFTQVDAGDEQSAAALDAYIGHLAQGIQAVHTALGCEVILGGVLASYLSPYLEHIRGRAQELDPFFDGKPFVRLARNPQKSVPVGAACMAAQRFIEELG